MKRRNVARGLIAVVTVVTVTIGCERESDDGELAGFREVGTGSASAQSADLTIGGAIAGGAPIYLDLETVRAYPKTQFRATDPWTEGVHLYQGVHLSQLLQFLGIEPEASVIEVHATNDYSAVIRRSDLENYRYILAYGVDGELFTEIDGMENRGTYVIAIDFESHRELDVEVYKHQLVWQVDEIRVR